MNNITGNFTLTAKASVVHTITVASTTNGTVTASPTSTFVGNTVTLTVTPSNNYALGNIVVTGSTSGNTYAVAGVGSTYTFVMPAHDNVKIEARTVAGMADDAAVLAYVWSKIKDDAAEYKKWQVKNGKAEKNSKILPVRSKK